MYIGLEVRDQGSGIPPEVLECLFEPFFTTKTEGTGLGLATVYGIVRQAGGTIDVGSLPGQGSCFTAWIPEEPEATTMG